MQTQRENLVFETQDVLCAHFAIDNVRYGSFCFRSAMHFLQVYTEEADRDFAKDLANNDYKGFWEFWAITYALHDLQIIKYYEKDFAELDLVRYLRHKAKLPFLPQLRKRFHQHIQVDFIGNRILKSVKEFAWK